MRTETKFSDPHPRILRELTPSNFFSFENKNAQGGSGGIIVGVNSKKFDIFLTHSQCGYDVQRQLSTNYLYGVKQQIRCTFCL